MASFVSLVLVTTAFILIVFVGLVLFRPPVYRLEKHNLIRLFELALSGQATDEDWEVFIHMPIRYDDELEDIRQQCEIMSEKKAFYVDSQRRLCLDDSAKERLSEFIKDLSAK